MASILDRYGIKEVADVWFYEKDEKGAPSAPVLYLDSLKVSTIEQSAEVVDATGGKGNVKLISWDTNKEVTATFEDALFSVKSLAIMFGGRVQDNTTEDSSTGAFSTTQEVLKSVGANSVELTGTTGAEKWKVPVGKHTVYVGKALATYFKYDKKEDGEAIVVPVKKSAVSDKDDFDFMTFDLLDATTSDGADAMTKGLEITIDASTFGGTYYITGDTYARNYQSGKDEYLQFIIPKGKVSSEDLSLTMEADGDPATFSMNINVLRDGDGTMFKLVKYTLRESATDDGAKNKGVASVLTNYDQSGGEMAENAGYATAADPVKTSKPSNAWSNE